MRGATLTGCACAVSVESARYMAMVDRSAQAIGPVGLRDIDLPYAWECSRIVLHQRNGAIAGAQGTGVSGSFNYLATGSHDDSAWLSSAERLSEVLRYFFASTYARH
jgi:hypothetical protein